MEVVAFAGPQANANAVRIPSPVLILMLRPLVLSMAGMVSPPFDGGDYFPKF